MGVDGLWKISVSPSQFCCKSKPSLKKLNDKKNKFNHHDIFREHFFLVLSISSPIHLKKFNENWTIKERMCIKIKCSLKINHI